MYMYVMYMYMYIRYVQILILYSGVSDNETSL